MICLTFWGQSETGILILFLYGIIIFFKAHKIMPNMY